MNKENQVTNEIRIRKGDISDIGSVLQIAKSLDDWFNEDGIKYIEQDLAFQKLIISEADCKPIGFLSFFTYEGIGYLGWLGVQKEYHGESVGEMLFLEFERIMHENEIHTLQVKTLGESVDYPPYDRTRKYYFKMGFTEYRTEITDNPGCPEELILRKRI